MFEILSVILWIWTILFIINVPLFLKDLKEINDEYGAVFNIWFTTIITLWTIFYRGPFATYEKIYNWYIKRRTLKVLHKIAKSQTERFGKPSDLVENTIKDFEEL